MKKNEKSRVERMSFWKKRICRVANKRGTKTKKKKIENHCTGGGGLGTLFYTLTRQRLGRNVRPQVKESKYNCVGGRKSGPGSGSEREETRVTLLPTSQKKRK